MARPERTVRRASRLLLALTATALAAVTVLAATAPADAASAPAETTTAPTAPPVTSAPNTAAPSVQAEPTTPLDEVTPEPTLTPSPTPTTVPTPTPVPQPRKFTTKPATVSGTAKVGKTLTATFPSWSPAPTTKKYRWLRDGDSIRNATGSRYTATASDHGHKLSVSITGSRTGYTTATRTQLIGVVVRGDAPKFTARPSVSGTTRNGGVLTTTKGSWNTSGLTARYEWLRNGKVVAGMTSRTYRLGYYDVGATIASRVTVSKAGYANGSVRSVATAKIARATASFSGNGTFKVGSTIKPGTYYSTTRQDQFCYWARLSSARGTLDDIRANDIGSGQRMIQVSSTDKYVELDDCGTWYAATTAGPKLSKIAGDGVYKVGQQVSKGTWKTTAPSGCYWATLSSASGSLDAIIANDYLDRRGSAVVTITNDVVAFSSSGCGTWTRVG
ncbi:hypothetical protein DEJ17_10715 [Curtobacterium sp. MCSS17_011]|nr:hypothetical protein DEJ17_10715 [Curtobacterium sp. MCSS17_011]